MPDMAILPRCRSESVLKLTDFTDFRNTNLSLWVTASCDIMPFDGLEANIGEYALLNDKGGAVAFYGTTRTVYAQYNRHINRAFIHRVLSLVRRQANHDRRGTPTGAERPGNRQRT